MTLLVNIFANYRYYQANIWTNTAKNNQKLKYIHNMLELQQL